MPKVHLRALPILLLFSAGLHADEIQGAEAILRRLKEPAEDAGQPKDALEALKFRLDAYTVESENLPPEKAAAEWLTLLETYLNLPPAERYRSHSSGTRISTDSVIKALPPTAAWDALAAATRKRAADSKSFRHAAEAYLGSLLARDPAGRLPAIERMEQSISEDETIQSYMRSNYQAEIAPLKELVSEREEEPADPVEQFGRQLDRIPKSRAVFYHPLAVPALPDTPAAKELLLRLLKSGKQADFKDDATRELAIQVAIEHLAELPEPPWLLITETRSIPLYEAAIKLHPESDQAKAMEDTMLSAYFHQYLQEGKEAEALAFLEDPRRRRIIEERHDVPQSLPRDAQVLLLKLFRTVLQKDPNRPLWRLTSYLAAELGQSGEFHKFLGEALENVRLINPKTRQEVEDLRLTQLFENEQVEEGITLLKHIIAKTAVPAGPDAEPEEGGGGPTPFASGGEALARKSQLLIRAIKLGHLLDRPELVDTSLDELARIIPRLSDFPDDQTLWKIYLERNRAGLAEKAIADRLARSAKVVQEPWQSDVTALLSTLAWIYDSLGRHQDVIRLLEEAPYWNAPDLAEIRSYSSGKETIRHLAAKALKATGQTERATTLVRHLIREHPGADAHYALLLELNPPDLLETLDEIAAANRFQERPLIWKARLLLNQGKTEEAEAIVRKAISIDPSDGEQGKGDRMRAYEVLADILEKKGDAEQTRFFRNVVAAIRLSETADDWWNAGLPETAIRIYEKSLQSFADAYCIQSRLALKYADMGDMAKATRHFQRAFELMPDSFGRIESHCFGCEGAFKGEVAQSIADKVFTELAAKPDAKPQVFYLLGYLRQSQERPDEAVDFFRKAVAKDPDYVNAWSKLNELAETAGMTEGERNEIAFNQFRLKPDPSVLRSASDLRRLWTSLLDLEEKNPPPPRSLYPLAAAAERLSRMPARDSYFPGSSHSSPRDEFARHTLVQTAVRMLEMSASNN